MEPILPDSNSPVTSQQQPGISHWQEGLENILNVFSPYLEPGKLIPVKPLEDNDINVFRNALEIVDLSPTLKAAFLPPSIADNIAPPKYIEDLQRIDKEQPSYKILIARYNDPPRILCAEISERAQKPGIDIFQSGMLLGSYNYVSAKDCLEFLTQAIRVHIWEKGKWDLSNYKKYTINWFEKVLDLEKGTVRVAEDYSYFHSPTIIKSDRITALFMLIYEILHKRLEAPDAPLKNAVSLVQNIENRDLRLTNANELAERILLELLNLIRKLEIIKFDEFSNVEKERFKNEFSRILQQLTDRIVCES
jgi:hypothetical protein